MGPNVDIPKLSTGMQWTTKKIAYITLFCCEFICILHTHHGGPEIMNILSVTRDMIEVDRTSEKKWFKQTA